MYVCREGELGGGGAVVAVAAGAGDPAAVHGAARDAGHCQHRQLAVRTLRVRIAFKPTPPNNVLYLTMRCVCVLQTVHSGGGHRVAPAERAAVQHAAVHSVLPGDEAAARRAAALVRLALPRRRRSRLGACALLLHIG